MGHDAVVMRGDPASRSFSACYLREGELIAVDTVNSEKDQMAARNEAYYYELLHAGA